MEFSILANFTIWGYLEAVSCYNMQKGTRGLDAYSGFIFGLIVFIVATLLSCITYCTWVWNWAFWQIWGFKVQLGWDLEAICTVLGWGNIADCIPSFGFRVSCLHLDFAYNSHGDGVKHSVTFCFVWARLTTFVDNDAQVLCSTCLCFLYSYNFNCY